MKTLLEYIVEYLAGKLNLVLSESAVIVKMPSEPTRCLCVYDDNFYSEVPPQVDASEHLIRIRVRDKTFLEALSFGTLAAGYMQTSDPQYPTVPLSAIDTTGIVDLAPDFSVAVSLVRKPTVVDAEDPTQSNERLVEFACKVISKKLF
ncbi:MAG: hypothetical protein IJ421_00245 [Prevotella sp.]|nr:hypothetical protein [Prevotella sp.]